LHARQSGSTGGLAESEPKDIKVSLPPGASFSLAATDGMETCSSAQIALQSSTQDICPEASKVGTAEITTPLLADPMRGAIFMAEQNANPFSSPLEIYVVAQDPVSGMIIKLAGVLQSNPIDGDLSIVLDELPQLPLSEIALRFFGGARALLTTPSSCGPATSTGEFTPWSGSAPVTSMSLFEVTECTAAFAPSLSLVPASNPNGAPTSVISPQSKTQVKKTTKPKTKTVCHFIKRGKRAKKKRVCKIGKVKGRTHKPKKRKATVKRFK
jgi:hypothetical protein